MARGSGVHAPALSSCHCDPLCVVLQLISLELLQDCPRTPDIQPAGNIPGLHAILDESDDRNIVRKLQKSSEVQSLV